MDASLSHVVHMTSSEVYLGGRGVKSGCKVRIKVPS